MESIMTESGLGSEPEPSPLDLSFTNTEIAFSSKSNSELKNTYRLFKLMNNSRLVSIGSVLTLWAVKLRIPFINYLIKKTIFSQFCGGENLLDCQTTIDRLYDFNTLTILDYGAEGKSDEEDLDAVLEENMRALEMAASNNSVPIVSVKITGLVDNEVLENLQKNGSLSTPDQVKYDRLLERMYALCEKANELRVGIFIDAEESWIQKPIDTLALELMKEYNKDFCVVYNTYQMYRHDKLAQLMQDHVWAMGENVVFGAKMVRGAYLEKENERAVELGYKSPIQPDKASTDRDFNAALKYCIENYQTISSCCASHNLESNRYQAELINDKNLDKTHPHLNFSQLYGMSDYITFNLADAGYNVAKYVPYGSVREVMPYLIRRAQENTSITGDMSRELSLIDKEMKRRGI
ncbi:MAG TPA: proline dehydrogenase family protein [Saprospiraceae bacterium]|nr:proline dehydrogenase family protein [Saprospiraceae bacterium]